MKCKRTASVLCFLAFVCACAFGQGSTGSLLGTVIDPGNAAVPGVQVAYPSASRTKNDQKIELPVYNGLTPQRWQEVVS